MLYEVITVPFIDVKQIDLSVHWKALFSGAIVGETIFDSPTVNFAVAGKEKEVTVITSYSIHYTKLYD